MQQLIVFQAIPDRAAGHSSSFSSIVLWMHALAIDRRACYYFSDANRRENHQVGPHCFDRDISYDLFGARF